MGSSACGLMHWPTRSLPSKVLPDSCYSIAFSVSFEILPEADLIWQQSSERLVLCDWLLKDSFTFKTDEPEQRTFGIPLFMPFLYRLAFVNQVERPRFDTLSGSALVDYTVSRSSEKLLTFPRCEFFLSCDCTSGIFPWAGGNASRRQCSTFCAQHTCLLW